MPVAVSPLGAQDRCQKGKLNLEIHSVCPVPWVAFGVLDGVGLLYAMLDKYAALCAVNYNQKNGRSAV